jgi:tetratricopeptide (TPR) repeat protein
MVLLLAVFVAATSGINPAFADALSDLEKAHNAYVAHKYQDAESRLRSLLDPKTGTLKDADSIADARMYLGAVLLAEGKKPEAAGVFEQLLSDKPDYQADSLRVALEAIDALIDARSRLREKLAAIQAERVHQEQEERAKVESEKQKAARHLATLEKLAAEELVIERNSRWKALIPFGVGQFQNGQDTLGWLFLTSESVMAVGSFVGAGLTLYYETQANDLNLHHDPTALAYNQRAITASLVGDLFAAGFFAVAAGGIVHAELTFVPERVQVQKRALPPLSLAPMVGPTGLGILGRF